MAANARCDLRCGVDEHLVELPVNNPLLPGHRLGPQTAIEEIRGMRDKLKLIIAGMNKRDMTQDALLAQTALIDLQKLELAAEYLEWTVP